MSARSNNNEVEQINILTWEMEDDDPLQFTAELVNPGVMLGFAI